MKIVVITGANRGIGLELVKKYVSNGDRVFALCRNPSSKLQSLDCKIIENIDVTEFKSLNEAKDQITGNIDILINNAGIMRDESFPLDENDFSSIREQFEVNALAPLKVVSTFENQLSAGAKIAMITSRMGSITDNTSGGRYGYRASKTALNMLSTSLSEDLKAREVSVGIFHPGWVQTDMTGGTGHLTAEQSAANLFQRIEELSLNSTGQFLHSNGENLPW